MAKPIIDQLVAYMAGSCGALTCDGGTMAKPFRCGHAAATGVTTALLAREGFTSDETALEERYGLLEAVGPLSEQILASLGKDLGVEWISAAALESNLLLPAPRPTPDWTLCCAWCSGKKLRPTTSNRWSATCVSIRWTAPNPAAATKEDSACLRLGPGIGERQGRAG